MQIRKMQSTENNNADSNTDILQRRVPKNGTGTENNEGFTFQDLAEYQSLSSLQWRGWMETTDLPLIPGMVISVVNIRPDMGVTGDEAQKNGTVYISVRWTFLKIRQSENDHCYRMTLC